MRSRSLARAFRGEEEEHRSGSTETAYRSPAEDAFETEEERNEELGPEGAEEFLEASVAGAMPVRMKLEISEPGDDLEREADRVAEEVVGANEEEPVEVQRKPAASSGGGEASPDAANAVSSLRGGGMSLPDSTRSFFEPRMGIDLSGVRVHTGPSAAEAARSIKAEAFTFGRDIAFGEGRWAPDTPAGKKLLAHELTHVGQQREFDGVGGVFRVVTPEMEEEVYSIPIFDEWIRRRKPSKKDLAELDELLQDFNFGPDLTEETLPPEAPIGFPLWVPWNVDSAIAISENRAFLYEAANRLFDIYILDCAQRLAKAGFGRAENPQKGGKFDKTTWMAVPPDKEAEERKLVKLEGVEASRAVDSIYENPQAWTFDCAQYVQAVRMCATRLEMGDEDFNEKYSKHLELHTYVFTNLELPPEVFPWEPVEVGRLFGKARMVEVKEAGKLYHFKRDGSPKGGGAEDASHWRKEAAIGSRFQWAFPLIQKLDPDSSFTLENAIKLGLDMYAQQPARWGIGLTEDELKTKLAQEVWEGLKSLTSSGKKFSDLGQKFLFYDDGKIFKASEASESETDEAYLTATKSDIYLAEVEDYTPSEEEETEQAYAKAQVQ